MIVLMASGNAAVMRPLDPTTSARTLTATIAAELGETAQGSLHWQVLFALGLLLFFVTGALDFVGHRAIGALRRRLHASVEDEA
jgi:phosphate transport system permease protein